MISDGMPVLAGQLHSQMIAAAAGLRAGRMRQGRFTS